MDSSDEDEDFSYHEGIIPQSKINSLFQSNTEKGIRRLCCELLDLKDSVENLCGNTRAKYLAFLRLSEEVVEMEHELTDLRKHISAQGILVQDLESGVFRELDECIKAGEQENVPELQNCEQDDVLCKDTYDAKRIFLEKIDFLLAEHKLQDALEVLEMEEKSSPDLRSAGDISSNVSFYKSAFLKRKATLEDQFVGISSQPSLGDVELKQALCGLLKLGKGPLAHQILLKRYASRLRNRVEASVPSCSLYPETYPATLSKIIFSFISLAAKESHSTFGDDPIYTNRVVQWAEEEIEFFVRFVKEHGPSSETITALRAASVCVQASLSNCIILELQGIKLSKLLMVLMRPYMEEVLEMNFRRARRVFLDISDNDDSPLLSPRFLSPLSVFAPSPDNALISNGVKFISIIKDIVDQLTPLAILQFGGNLLSRIVQLFDNYVDLLTKALPSPSEDDGITELKETLPFKAETDSQQLALLGVANSVADELLPMAVSRIWNINMETHDPSIGSHESISSIGGNAVEFKDWRRQLQHSLDKLRDHFCRQYVLNFIYSREGNSRLDARIYVDEEGENLQWESVPLPSLPFQALFARLQQLATVAGDVLLGKEKLQKVLLARLTETIVMWLSDEQEFWGVFEDESVPLKPFGLQQLTLDMHFTVEIARFAGYSSRHVLQLASGIIARAVKTFSARGIDPQSTLPEDEWFSEAAKAAINKLLLGASGSEASEPDEEQEHDFLHQQHIVSDSEDSISCTSTVDSFHSFASAETGDLDSPSHIIDHEA
ncbi:exocyst complex component EXO84C-like [Chenopodium quinoa]|uniref:exocyst complex component EXO84C-like n=1 Tax=Chenopodium quinoa TaxID=63459 RepID=UPI000B79A3D8|nr:exocyst complex component EXO84C-like [Chenopodium quinoa]